MMAAGDTAGPPFVWHTQAPSEWSIVPRARHAVQVGLHSPVPSSAARALRAPLRPWYAAPMLHRRALGTATVAGAARACAPAEACAAPPPTRLRHLLLLRQPPHMIEHRASHPAVSCRGPASTAARRTLTPRGWPR